MSEQRYTGVVSDVAEHSHAFMLGAKWALDNLSATLAEQLQAAMQEGRRHKWNASHLTEFGLGVGTIREGVIECIQRHTTQEQQP